MRSSWRAAARSERFAVPVEMRFIDMFMAALGALIFMAMLLAFLMRYIPPGQSGIQPLPPPNHGAFQILTKTLPAGRIGEFYEVAFAYRGGQGAVSWEIKSGAQEIHAGMKFDDQRGVLSGTPSQTGKVRFVLLAHDVSGATDEKPYELTLESAPKGSGQTGKRIAIAMLVVLGLIWLFVSLGVLVEKRQVRDLERAYASGQTRVSMHTGAFTQEVIELPGGIQTYRGRLKISQYVSWFLLIVIMALSVWFYFTLKRG
jgi:Putative Ig domain